MPVRVRPEMVHTTDKGLPVWAADLPVAEFVSRRPSLVTGAFLLPLLTADDAAVDNNITAMAAYVRAAGAQLCPHGKTTMSPELFRRQLAAGAWGLTAATVSQIRTMRAFGVDRILLANELVDPAGLDWVLAELDRSPDFQFYAYVDSDQGLAAARAALARRGPGRALPLLVELGIAGARTGCRSVAEAERMAEAVRALPGAELAGVAGYEGVLGRTGTANAPTAVRGYLRELRILLASLAAAAPQAHHIVSVGGSIYFDLVLEELAPEAIGDRATLVLRSGCYVSHDHGMYAASGPASRGRGPALRPALRLWAQVVSAPEPDLALVGFGRRDCAFDAGLPIPLHRLGAAGVLEPVPAAEVVDLNDQHAFLRHEGSVQVGQVLAFGISHPCTTFDKWRLIPVLAEDLTVVDCLTTYF